MAQQVIVTIASDISGEPEAHKAEFGIDGVSYEIDLTDAEDQELRERLAPYAAAGRKVGGSKRGRPAKASSAATGGGSGLSPDERKAVRDYAAANGVELAQRGRINELAITAWRREDPSILEHLRNRQMASA